MIKRGVIFVLFLVLFSISVNAQLNLTLTKDKLGTGQPFAGYLLINLSEPMPSTERLIFRVNDQEIETKTLKNITVSLKNATIYPQSIVADGNPLSSKDLRFTQPGSNIALALDLSQNGVLKQSNIQDILEFTVTFQGSQGITSPSLNIGNDKDVEWTYVGPAKPGVYIPLNKSYLGNNQPSGEVILTGNSDDIFCQNITLEPASNYRIHILTKALTQANLNATLSKTKPSSSIGLCGDDAPCCTFTTKPTTLQQASCDITLNVRDKSPYYLCAFVDTDQIETEHATLAYTTTKPGYGFRAGRPTSLNYFLSADYQDYERQLATSFTFTSSEAAAELKEHAKKQGCGDKCLLVPLNISAKSAGTLTIKDLKIKVESSSGRFEVTTFTPVTVQPERIQYNKSLIKEQLSTYLELTAPTTEEESLVLQAFLGEEQSNEGVFSVVRGPEAGIRYNSLTLTPTQQLSVQAIARPVENRLITNYEWDFGDGQTSKLMNTTHAYSKSGDYTVRLTVTDREGITGTDSIIVTVTTKSLSEELADAQTALTGLQQKITQQQYSTVAQLLKLSDNIVAAQANLTLLKTSYDGLAAITNESQRLKKEEQLLEELRNLQRGIPQDIIIEQTINFDGTVTSSQEIPSSLALTNEQAVVNAQNDFTSKGIATLVHLPTALGTNSFILVQKTIVGTGDHYELLPTGLTFKELFTPGTPDGSVIKYSGNSITYTVEGNSIKELAQAATIKTLTVPGNLPETEEKEPTVLNLGQCGNDTCEAGEDDISCPEDCKAPTPIIPFIILGIILIGGIVWIFVYKGKYSFSYFFSKKTQSLARMHFQNDKDYVIVKSYVNQSLIKGFKDDQIKFALKKKGWSEQQITAVLDEVHREKMGNRKF
ncbi:MAG: PKD domain-containing protein [Candidatus Nanoarchaeia archaeon]